MQPFPASRRRFYFLAFLAVFVVLLPVVIMYADGWRWKSGFGLVRTGAVYIEVPYSDAVVYFDGREFGRSGFLQRSFYIDNLAPAAYAVSVVREGFLPWSRVLAVEQQLVTDAEALLIPKRIEPMRLAFSGVATTSGVAVIPRAQYDAYLAAFGTTTPSAAASGARSATQSVVVATTTVPQAESGGIGLLVVEGDVYARWMSEDAFPPSRFCGRPSLCVREFAIERSAEEARTARFFRGGAVFATREGGVYFSEIDVRPTPLNVKLFEAPEADIRVIDDALIIKSGSTLYRITL